jgi:hypothetical protein
MLRHCSAPKRLGFTGATVAAEAADAGVAVEPAACRVAAAITARTTTQRINPCRRTRATLKDILPL